MPDKQKSLNRLSAVWSYLTNKWVDGDISAAKEGLNRLSAVWSYLTDIQAAFTAETPASLNRLSAVWSYLTSGDAAIAVYEIDGSQSPFGCLVLSDSQ